MGFSHGDLISESHWVFFDRFCLCAFRTRANSAKLKSFSFYWHFRKLTTFSTYMFESYEFFKMGDIKMALSYIAISNVLGLLMVYLGFVLAEYFEKMNA